jgi:hypothetical protein
MELDASKQVCGFCKEWKGPREWVDGKVRVKSSARARCQSIGQIKPPHGGCNFWSQWQGEPER